MANPTLTATLARLAQQVFAWEFTSTFQVGGRLLENGGCISELSDTDKLEIAGRDLKRSINVMVITADLTGARYTQGDAVVLDGDTGYQIAFWKLSPDGATTIFTLIDSN